MLRKPSYYAVLVFFVFYFYNVKFKFLPASSFTWSSLLLLIYFIVFLVGSQNIRLPTKTIFSVFSWFLLSIAFLMSSLKNEANLYIYRFLIVFFVSAVIFPLIFFRVYKYKREILYKLFGLVGLVNAFFIISMFIFPDVKSFWLSFVDSIFERHRGEVNLESSLMSLRMIGIPGFSGYSTAVMQISFLLFYMLSIFYTKKDPSLVDIGLFSIVILSAILSARTSFVILPLAFIFYAYLFKLKSLLFLTTFLSICLISLTFSVNILFDDRFSSFFSNWMFELFESGTSVGSLETNLKMVSMYGVESYSFLGDFKLRASDGGYYMDTDVGYSRILFSVGFFGFLMLGLFILSLVPLRIAANPEVVLSWTLLAIISIVLFKGLVIFDAYPILSLLSVLGLFSTVKLERPMNYKGVRRV